MFLQSRENKRELIPYHRPFPLSKIEQENIFLRMKAIFKTGMISNAYYCRQLEEKIKEIYNVKYCITTSNCSMGLYLCYQFYSFLKKFCMPEFTWRSPYLLFEKQPDFIDIDIDYWIMRQVESKEDILAMPVFSFGNTFYYKGEHVVYDGAHAFGSKLLDIGKATVFSLAPTKLITSCEGGLIITNDDELAKFLEYRRDACCRMSEVHAIIGLQTLEHLDEVKKWKRKVYEYYKRFIPGMFQKIAFDHNFNTIGFLNIKELKIPSWIETKQYYEPVWKYNSLPDTEYVYKNIVCLPSFFGVDYEKIANDILKFNNL